MVYVLKQIISLCVLIYLTEFTLGSQLSNIEKLLNISHYETPKWSPPDVTYMNDFGDLTIISYTGEQNFTIQANDSALLYYSNDTFVKLFDTAQDAKIEKIVPYQDDSFILSGSGQINGIDLGHQVLLNLTSLTTKPLLSNPIKNVNALLAVNNSVIIAGNFSYKVSNVTGHGVVMWHGSDNSTKLLPFGGFSDNSTVNSIVQLDNENILFAGEFQNIQNSTLLRQLSNGSNGTSHKDIADLQFDQSVSLKLSSVIGGNVQQDALFCPSSGDSNGWLVSGSVPSSLQINLKNEIRPSKVRIYNSLDQDSEVSLFRIITSPSNGIMNLTYLDPSSGEIKQCDAWCPLLSSKTLTELYQNSSSAIRSVPIDNNSTNLRWSDSYQEFAFVNDVPVTMLQFFALDSYGSNVALHSVELFETEFMVYANNTYNEPNCESTTDYSKSELSADNWYIINSGSNYMATNIQNNKPYVNFFPNITYPGQYTLNMYTPGCLNDNSCSQRGIVNVTLMDPSSNEILATKLIYQTNDQDKFDPLFSGFLQSTPEVILSWDQALGENSIMVADRLGVITESIDTKKIYGNSTFELNGLFQYNTKNISKPFTETNDTLSNYAVDNFPGNASLFAALFGDELLIAGNFNGISKVDLDNDTLISSSQRLGTTGFTTGIFEYSEGLLFTGSFDANGQNQHEILSYDGNSFNSFGQLSEDITNVVNFTVDGSELLLFDQAYIFNVSSNAYISNSSTFAISGVSSGANKHNDSLLFGSILKKTIGNLNDMAVLSPDGQVSSPNLPQFPATYRPYKATYINDTTVVYALQEVNNNSTSYRVVLTSTNSTSSQLLQLEWSEPINTLLFNERENILAIGTNGTSKLNQNDVQFSVVNLTGFESVAKQSFDGTQCVNSMVSFEKNNSILVGGSYKVEGCQDICLYDYRSDQWKNFLNGSISGKINQLQFSNEGSTLLIGGLLQVDNKTDIQLLSLNLTNNNLSVIKSGSKPLVSFSLIGQSIDNIIAQTEDDLEQIQNGNVKSILPQLNENSSIAGFTVLSYQNSKKRADTSHIILLDGELNAHDFGTLNSMVYDDASQEWSPFFVTSGSKDSQNQLPGSFFQDIDNLYLSSSQTVLTSNNSSHAPVSTPKPTPTKKPSHKKKNKINRGWIVLIGLALALATISVIGLIGAIFSYLFMSHKGYESLKPRINQDEMLDTIPPEKLMKFI